MELFWCPSHLYRNDSWSELFVEVAIVFDVISSDVHCEKEDGTSPITAYESASTTECTYTWKDSGSD